MIRAPGTELIPNACDDQLGWRTGQDYTKIATLMLSCKACANVIFVDRRIVQLDEHMSHVSITT